MVFDVPLTCHSAILMICCLRQRILSCSFVAEIWGLIDGGQMRCRRTSVLVVVRPQLSNGVEQCSWQCVLQSCPRHSVILSHSPRTILHHSAVLPDSQADHNITQLHVYFHAWNSAANAHHQAEADQCKLRHGLSCIKHNSTNARLTSRKAYQDDVLATGVV